MLNDNAEPIFLSQLFSKMNISKEFRTMETWLR